MIQIRQMNRTGMTVILTCPNYLNLFSTISHLLFCVNLLLFVFISYVLRLLR